MNAAGGDKKGWTNNNLNGEAHNSFQAGQIRDIHVHGDVADLTRELARMLHEMTLVQKNTIALAQSLSRQSEQRGASARSHELLGRADELETGRELAALTLSQDLLLELFDYIHRAVRGIFALKRDDANRSWVAAAADIDELIFEGPPPGVLFKCTVAMTIWDGVRGHYGGVRLAFYFCQDHIGRAVLTEGGDTFSFFEGNPLKSELMHRLVYREFSENIHTALWPQAVEFARQQSRIS